MAVQHPLLDQTSTMVSDFVNGLNASFAETVERNRTLATKGIDLLKEETLAFADRRLDRNRDAVERWHGCKEMTDLMNLQQEWLSQLAQDYYDGSMRTAALMQQMVVERLTPNGKAARAEPEKPKVPAKRQEDEHARQPA